jgi:hypothetical protein
VLKGWPGRLEGPKFPYNDEVTATFTLSQCQSTDARSWADCQVDCQPLELASFSLDGGGTGASP